MEEFLKYYNTTLDEGNNNINCFKNINKRKIKKQIEKLNSLIKILKEELENTLNNMEFFEKDPFGSLVLKITIGKMANRVEEIEKINNKLSKFKK